MSRVIAAISTAPAPAGIGMVRLSGDGAVEIASKIFRPRSKTRSLEKTPGYTALYGWVYDADGDIDECVALVFRAPHSYTGEDVVELTCHGGLYLLQRTLRAAIDAGARPAEPGEFTKRAFVNGNLDLTGAEAVMDIIAANGRMAAKTALAAREGALYRKMRGVLDELTTAAANLSAFVDYPDDDIPELQPAALKEILQNARLALGGLLKNYDAGRVVREGIDTVIVGRPNVGKSTLMNLLAGYERSIVTSVAGTTRDIVEDTIRLGDIVLRLADTAGQRETSDEVESIGVRRARERMERAELVLAVFDGAEQLNDDDMALAKAAAGQPSIAVINKADIGININEEYIQNLFKHTVIISAQKGEGLEQLEQAVREVTGVAALNESEPLLATERQRDCAKRCLECVNEAIEALDMGYTLDAVGVSIDGAIGALLELTGERATEAVVDKVFERFCVGK
ncbi:MAG: tRNA uridine-5-carboxymethylaminomethyl(34) synthesis GTPase MnmE [Clostridiales bacterium]|jgi:tRNA modification GTPase|nr:tRNA uridine-5-carboxymethylaminomethyl(34) synthesis GTPase MnmE [Clostridiales bacterium]